MITRLINADGFPSRVQLQTVSTFLIGYASLNSIGPDWLILEGSDDAQKVQNMLQNLLANVSPEYAPAQADWNYKTQGTSSPISNT